MINLLDTILLSDNVVNEFYQHYCGTNFKTWLIDILPEIEDCKNQQQDNPWHIYNCLDHILHSVEAMNRQTKDLPYNVRRLLAYTMFYHDLGKPACYIKRFSKLYGRMVDSFFEHNIVSTDIAKRTLKYFNFSDKDITKIQHLIYNHDIFMFVTLQDDNNPHHHVLTPTLIHEKISNFNQICNGYELMQYLIMVRRADNLAQNPQMTKNSLHLIDVMKSMLEQLNLSH
jgi:tRNA nucleotidyltransferase (CCA-adding enzyme)